MGRAQARADAMLPTRALCVKGIVAGVDGEGRNPDIHTLRRAFGPRGVAFGPVQVQGLVARSAPKHDGTPHALRCRDLGKAVEAV